MSQHIEPGKPLSKAKGKTKADAEHAFRVDQYMRSYHLWKGNLMQTIEEYRLWLREQELINDEIEEQLADSLTMLDEDQLTVAFIAEYSRGKSELINAIFFADTGMRLLPSNAGRTTMSPTELFWDQDKHLAYLKLLPIETRNDKRNLRELKQDKDLWETFALDTENPDQMAATLKKLTDTQLVDVKTAESLGLFHQDMKDLQSRLGRQGEQVEVPKWRHALISYPHPLLQNGLSVLDTPGMNALGAEPELTLNMLPQAQAVLFLLGIETGVTKSDEEMWQHIKRSHGDLKNGLIVALNKIDALRDELKTDKEYEKSLKTQCESTAQLLGVDRKQVFPVSAKEGLLAKVKDDPALLKNSRMGELETYLCNALLENKQQIMHDRILENTGALIASSHEAISNRLIENRQHLAELHKIAGKGADIAKLIIDSKTDQAEYKSHVTRYMMSRKLFKKQSEELLENLSIAKMDRTINSFHSKLDTAMTTRALQRTMADFFETICEQLYDASSAAAKANNLCKGIYDQFENVHGLKIHPLPPLSLELHISEMERLRDQADRYRESPFTIMSSKSVVINRFFVLFVSRARSVLLLANKKTQTWLNTSMTPLEMRIAEHRRLLSQRVENLVQIRDERSQVQHQIMETTQNADELKEFMNELQDISRRMNQPMPFDVIAGEKR